ncbi:MAG TPA: isoprenylcysteine carboxylmethyltransferase family protein [Steroidobacteraceae bacterium]
MDGIIDRYCWGAFALVWLIAAAFTKPTLRATGLGTRAASLAMLLVGFYLVIGDWPRAWLATPWVPATLPMKLLGVGLTISGCSFAIWARLALGRNWSGRPTVKAEHELVVSGPYALTRHPIYTGILLATFGTMLADSQWQRILGVLLVTLGLLMKIRQEERLMVEAFPKNYPPYQRRVKALIPGVL